MSRLVQSTAKKSNSPINTTLIAKQQIAQPVNTPQPKLFDPKFNFNLSKIPISSPHRPSQPLPKINHQLVNKQFPNHNKRKTKLKISETAFKTITPPTSIRQQKEEDTAKLNSQKQSSELLEKLSSRPDFSLHLNQMPISATGRSTNTPPMQPKIKVRISSAPNSQRINNPNFANQSKARSIKQNTRISLQKYPNNSVLKLTPIQTKIKWQPLVSAPWKERINNSIIQKNKLQRNKLQAKAEEQNHELITQSISPAKLKYSVIQTQKEEQLLTKANSKIKNLEVPAVEKRDEELARDIMNTQLAILEGWDTALENFDKVLTSASDKETKPNFNKVIKSFLEDKLMGELISRTKSPAAVDAFALFNKLTDEIKRASAASESAALRDFYVQHRTAIGKLKQQILQLETDFEVKVRQTREKMEVAERISMQDKKDKEKAVATIASSRASDEYGLMRLHLVETLTQLNNRLKISTPKNLFRMLSEKWIRLATIGRLRNKLPAVVLIRLKKDYSIINAHIQGAGGEKIAKQLLEDSPNGVDVFNLKVRRTIILEADNGWQIGVLKLDANNRNLNKGARVEGKWWEVERFVMTNGLPPTKKLTGD